MLGTEMGFDVEHALIMFAESYVVFPAWGLYDEQILSPLLDQANKCHVYMIGFVPKVDFLQASQVGKKYFCHMQVSGEVFSIPFDLPDGMELGCDEGAWYLYDKKGKRYFPNESYILTRLSLMTGRVYFDVQYVGQAFGKDGSRNALDRLKKHETLQKISIKGIPDDHNLMLLLLKVKEGSTVMTSFNPSAADQTQSDKRLKDGLDKLFEPNEAERTTLYEASLIRHFEPRFNKEFKDSFPSTNLKVLNDCYEKDFSALVAEICFDDLPFVIKSDKQDPAPTIMAIHKLHASDARDMFFGLTSDS